MPGAPQRQCAPGGHLEDAKGSIKDAAHKAIHESSGAGPVRALSSSVCENRRQGRVG